MSSRSLLDPPAGRALSVACDWTRTYPAGSAGAYPSRTRRMLDAKSAPELGPSASAVARPTMPASNAPQRGLSAPPLPHLPPVCQRPHQPRTLPVCGDPAVQRNPHLAPQFYRSLTASLLAGPRIRSHCGRMGLQGNATTTWFIRRIPNHPTACHFPATSLPFAPCPAGAGFLSFHRHFTDVSPTFSRDDSF